MISSSVVMCRAARPDPLNSVIRNWIWTQLISTELKMTSSCRAARPDPLYSRCTVIREDTVTKAWIWWKSFRLVTFWPLPHISFNSYSKLHRELATSSQLTKHHEQDWQGADTMRMFSQLWQKHGFDEKLTVLWRSGHCRRFHSASIVNCTENRPLSAS